ncbi:hypothetical protein BS78_05G080500 [Paspalum vaginatum]|nr:hypothetical protein BS78_05G080500 [Paspalum vaginatum]KAJ1274685.1 hypothetical protein BS78_05G080500 [Paspalum vaginatum]
MGAVVLLLPRRRPAKGASMRQPAPRSSGGGGAAGPRAPSQRAPPNHCLLILPACVRPPSHRPLLSLLLLRSSGAERLGLRGGPSGGTPLAAVGERRPSLPPRWSEPLPLVAVPPPHMCGRRSGAEQGGRASWRRSLAVAPPFPRAWRGFRAAFRSSPSSTDGNEPLEGTQEADASHHAGMDGRDANLAGEQVGEEHGHGAQVLSLIRQSQAGATGWHRTIR